MVNVLNATWENGSIITLWFVYFATGVMCYISRLTFHLPSYFLRHSFLVLYKYLNLTANKMIFFCVFGPRLKDFLRIKFRSVEAFWIVFLIYCVLFFF